VADTFARAYETLGGLPVVESPLLPLRPSPTEEARRIVRHGLRDVLEWLEMEIGPEPGHVTHCVIAMDPARPGARMLYGSKELIEQLRVRAQWVDCVKCGHPTDSQDPQPCDEGGSCSGDFYYD